VEKLKEGAEYFIDLNPLREELGLAAAGDEANSN
jgi:hypothetical protein